MKAISYIGCDDETLDLFEGQYALPDGMCYNSYLLCADKVAVLDTIDKRCTDEWLNKLEKSDRKSTRLNSSHYSASRMPSSA